jgi:hypothetical protein
MAQWNKDTQSYRSQDTTNFEVMMLGDHWGEQADFRPSFTSQNRLKTSPYQTVFFNTFQYGKETDIWDEEVTGTASAVHNANASNITMSVGSTAGDKVVRQTRAVMRYIPGRTSTISFAIRLETPVEGVRRRFGIFDADNGAYFEDNGGVYSYVIRSKTSGSVVETRVLRDDWNGDKLDGNGFSQHTADPTKQQMIHIEYEWYGAGQVKFAWVIDGETIVSHTFNHANVIDKVWCSTPFLPIRCELENVTGAAGTHYLYQGSNSLISEGEPEKLGILVSQATGTAGRTMSSSNTYYPVLSIRLKSNQLTGIVLPRSLQVATNDNTNVFWRLVRNPTLTGASWQPHNDPDSFMEYDLSATAMTGGTNTLNGFTIGGGSSLTDIDDKAALQLGRGNLGTVSDIYTLACASPNTNKAALAVLNWIEQR